ncbi:MAG TPA: hypothetical protein VMW67_07020 [Desulfobacteria bacterium]|nr:hypothetical protein [Desulfobacteria bacterium]
MREVIAYRCSAFPRLMMMATTMTAFEDYPHGRSSLVQSKASG